MRSAETWGEQGWGWKSALPTRPLSRFWKKTAPPPSWSVTPSPCPKPVESGSVGGGIMEEEKTTKEASKSSGRRRSSVKSVQLGSVRELWSTATLSQSGTKVSLDEVCENFDDEGRNVGATRRRFSRCVSPNEKLNLNPEEMEEHTMLELERQQEDFVDHQAEEEEEAPQDTKTEIGQEKSPSLSSVGHSRHMPHPAYWAEQQNRLPLPLMELMENEALEILNKALKSYKSGIGENHFMTKELQGYIEGLKKRKIKRLYCLSQ